MRKVPKGETPYEYASRLLKHVAPQCEVLPDLMGVLSQIDNWMTKFTEDAKSRKLAQRREAQRRYRERHRERVLARARRYREIYPERARAARQREYQRRKERQEEQRVIHD